LLKESSMKKLILLVIFIFANAGDFEKGLEYYQKLNYTKAQQFFIKGCQTDKKSCNYLGVLYENGLGVQKNINKALEYYQLSCNSNMVKACINLGSLYSQLNQKDKAKKAFKKSCKLGYKPACYLAK